MKPIVFRYPHVLHGELIVHYKSFDTIEIISGDSSFNPFTLYYGEFGLWREDYFSKHKQYHLVQDVCSLANSGVLFEHPDKTTSLSDIIQHLIALGQEIADLKCRS